MSAPQRGSAINLRRLLYRLIRTGEWFGYGVHRLVGSLVPRRWERAGECRRCGQCCQTPSLSLSPLLARVRPLLALFLAWQRFVNGFEFLGLSEDRRVAIFRCRHYDPVQRLCRDYANRPVNCRTYPRIETWFGQPRFLDECGFYAVPRHAERLTATLTPAEARQMEDYLRRRSRSGDPAESLGAQACGDDPGSPAGPPAKEIP